MNIIDIMAKKKIKEQESEKKVSSPRGNKKKVVVDMKEEPSPKEEKIMESISWRAAEYERIQKPLSWYVSIIGGTLAIALIAFWSGNVFFGVFILSAGGLLLFFSGRHPQILEFSISQEGIEIEEKMKIPFEAIHSFSMRSRPHALDELIIKKKTNVNPYIRIPIDNTLAEKVRTLLRHKISEVEYEESIIDLISDRFGL